MSPAPKEWLSLLIAALFGLLFLLRIRFRNAPKYAETAVLFAATILFFSICTVFLKPAKIYKLNNPPASRSLAYASTR